MRGKLVELFADNLQKHSQKTCGKLVENMPDCVEIVGRRHMFLYETIGFVFLYVRNVNSGILEKWISDPQGHARPKNDMFFLVHQTPKRFCAARCLAENISNKKSLHQQHVGKLRHLMGGNLVLTSTT